MTQDLTPGQPVTYSDWKTEEVDLVAYGNELAKLKYEPTMATGTAVSPFEINPRYPEQKIGVDNEDLYGQAQSWGSKAMNATMKGVVLAGTTFLEGTSGLVNGLFQWTTTGDFTSLYNNEHNNLLNGINEKLREEYLPNFYTAKETNAEWYSPDNLFTANFIFDKVISNLGFAAGAAASGIAYSAALKAVPVMGKLFSTAKAAEALAASEEIVATAKTSESLGKLKSLSDRFITSYNVLNPAERITVSALSTVGEASIEAQQNLNDFRNKLINEYIVEKGIRPEGEDLEQINQYANKVGDTSFGLNAALLTATNYIQLPKILGSSYRAEKGVANALKNETQEIVKDAETGLFKSALPEKGFGKLAYKAKNFGSLFFSGTEAFEEGSQFAIQAGTQNYFDKQYRGRDANILADLIGEGYRQALTEKEGLESLLIGGISGGIMTSFSPMGDNTVKQRGFTGYGGAEAVNTAEAIKAFNNYSLTPFMKETVEGVNRGVTLQEERESAIRKGDFLESKDLETDYVHNYLTPRIKFDRYDLVIDDIAEYKKLGMSDTGFAQLQAEGKASAEDTRESFLVRLENFEKHAKNVKGLYDTLNLRYKGVTDKEGKRIYSDRVIDKLVYSAAKITDYDTRLVSLFDKLAGAGIVASTIVDDVSEGRTDTLKAAIEQIDAQPITSDQKEAIKQDLVDTLELSLRRKKFLNEYEQIKKFPNAFEETEGEIEEKETSADIKIDEDLIVTPGRQYEKVKGKQYTVKQNENQFNVVSPTGEIVGTFDDKLDAQKDRDTRNVEEVSTLNSLRVVELLESGLLHVIDSEGKSQFIDPTLLRNYQRVMSEEEKVLADKTKNDKFDKEGETDTVDTPEEDNGDTVNDVTIATDEDLRKPIDVVFLSSTFNAKDSKSYTKRTQAFFTNIDKFPNRDNLRAILITANNEAATGATGLIDYLIEGTTYSRNNPVDAPLVQVYVEQVENDLYFVDAEGKRLGKVGEPANIDELVFGTMATDSLFFREEGRQNQLRYQEETATPEEATAYQDAYREQREVQFAKTTIGAPFEFVVSKGIPILTAQDEDGNYEKNSVFDTLIEDRKLLSNQGLVVVSTGSVEFNGENLSYPSGTTLFKNGSTLEFLNNRTPTNSEVNSLFNILKFFVEDSNKKNTINKEIQNYLKGVFYYRMPKGETKPSANQMFVKGGFFNIGENKIPFTLKSFEDNEALVKEWLGNLYLNANNKLLQTNKPFREILEATNEGVKAITWKTYQHYLLSDKYDIQENNDLTGKIRGINNIPLRTSLRKISKDVPFDSNYHYKYATLLTDSEGAELFTVDLPQAEQEKVEVKEAVETQYVGSFVADGETPNTFVTALGEPVNFFLSQKAEGMSVAVILDEDFIKVRDRVAKQKGYSEERILEILTGMASEKVFKDLEVTEPQPTEEVDAKIEEVVEETKEAPTPPKEDNPYEAQYRAIIAPYEYVVANMEREEKWFKERLDLPFHRLSNLIQTTSGGYAFGQFYQAAVSVYENAEVGTTYHEAFEAVWAMFTDFKERKNMLDEFRGRNGSFTERETSLEIPYKDASEKQIKEQLAEEFREYILTGDVPYKPEKTKNVIFRFFKELLAFLKKLFTGDITVEQMFKRIDAGYYKGAPSNPNYFNAPQYREKIGELTVGQEHMVVRGIATAIVQNLFVSNRSLVEFDSGTPSVQAIFNKVREDFRTIFTNPNHSWTIPGQVNAGQISEDQYKQYLKLWNDLDNNWGKAARATSEYLKTFSIIADLTGEDIDDLAKEELEIKPEEDDANKPTGPDAYVKDPFKLDVKRGMSASVKLLIATLPESKFKDDTKQSVVSVIDPSTYMQQMVNYSQTINFLLNQLHTLNTWNEKKAKILELSKSYPNLVRLASRLDLKNSNPSLEQWNINAKLNGVLSKQKPAAFIHFIDGNKSYLQTDNLNIAINKQIQTWIDALKQSKTSLITTNEEGLFEFNGKELSKYKTKTLEDQLEFLNFLGIDFTVERVGRLTSSEKGLLAKQTQQLLRNLSKKEGVVDITAKALDSAGTMQSIAKLYLKSIAEDESTFLGLNGEMRQQYILGNTISNLTNDYNNPQQTRQKLLSELPHLNKPFSSDSLYMRNFFFTEDGTRTENTFTIGYNQGLKNVKADQPQTNDKLTEPVRLMEEINQNLNKNYYILVPADSKTEWMLTMDHLLPFQNFYNSNVNEEIYNIFNTYYQTERGISLGKNGKPRDDYKGLMYPIMNGYDSESLSPEVLQSWINGQVKSLIQNLKDNLIIIPNPKKPGFFNIKNIDTDFLNRNELSKDFTDADLERLFTFTEVNYQINNIEIHKLFFGDVNQIKDPLKRYKSFISPRESAMYNTPEFNAKLNQELNKAVIKRLTKEGAIEIIDIPLEETDPYYWTNKGYMRTATMADVDSYESSVADDENLPEVLRNPFKASNSTDAQSWAFLPAFREIMWKNGGRFSEEQEVLFQFLSAQDRLLMEEDGHYTYTNERLKKIDTQTLAKGYKGGASLPILKPIGSGFDTEGNTFLDKTSLAPLSYSLVRGTIMETQYIKMWKQGISYLIVESGRKIGAQVLNTFYNENGTINNSELTGIVDIPHRWFGVQVETAGDKKDGPVGSQASKLVSMNLRNNGVPIDYEGTDWNELSEEQKLERSPIYGKIKRNERALEALQNNGYEELLKKFGIVDNGTYFSAPDKTTIVELIKNELFRRDAPENIKDAIAVTEEGNFVIPLEATAKYTQIKSILYSYVDKLIVKPRVTGGMKIQTSGVIFQHGNREIKTVKVKGKDKVVYVSTDLKFYKAEYQDGKRTSVGRMEILLPNWFANKLRSSKVFQDLSDDELIKYLNNTKEGKKILNGVGFRIPTQEINSIEAFTVAGFLPEWVGEAVAVPEALTTKVGSDFDVDKLNLYLKNIYIDNNGDIKLVPYFGTGTEAKAKIKNLVDSFENAEDLKRTLAASKNKYIGTIYELEKELETQEKTLNAYVDTLYKQSLENEYFESMEDLLLLPENFERLIKPNSAQELKDIRTTLVDLAPSEFGFSKTASPLDRQYMSKQRHLFLVGIGGVGIGAIAQTNNAINQSSRIYLNPDNIPNLNYASQRVINSAKFKDLTIRLPHSVTFIKGREYATLSRAKDTSGQYVSDKLSRYLDGFVDIAKDPFISQIIQDPRIISTFLFLEKIGVDGETVALFMNQPIIREYMKLIGLQDTNRFYNKNIIRAVRKRFSASVKTIELQEEINVSLLKSNISKFYSNGKEKLSEEQRAQQQLILDEFFKYEMLSQQLFAMQRGVSFDTDSSPDPYMQYRKQKLVQAAQESNIFSSIDDLFDNTMLGNLSKLVPRSSKAIDESFTVMGKPVIQDLIKQVIDKLPGRLNKEQYQKAARSIEEYFITYLVQTNEKINTEFTTLLKNSEKNVANRVWAMKKALKSKPNSSLATNEFVKQLITIVGNKKTEVRNLSVARKVSESFTSDIYTASFRELKNNPLTMGLYNDIITLSFLQSGLTQSMLSFKDYIPYEDFAARITPILERIESLDNLQEFVDLGMFFRNKWSDKTIVPNLQEEWEQIFVEGQATEEYKNLNALTDKNQKWFLDLKARHGIKDSNYRAIKVPLSNPLSYSTYVTFTRTLNPAEEKIMTPEEVKAFKPNLRLYQRLEDLEGNPIKGEEDFFHIFVPINPLGDGIRAQEFYSTIQPSVLNTATYKIENELPMSEILVAKQGIVTDIPNNQEITPEEGSEKTVNQNKTNLGFKPGKC